MTDIDPSLDQRKPTPYPTIHNPQSTIQRAGKGLLFSSLASRFVPGGQWEDQTLGDLDLLTLASLRS